MMYYGIKIFFVIQIEFVALLVLPYVIYMRQTYVTDNVRPIEFQYENDKSAQVMKKKLRGDLQLVRKFWCVNV